MIQTPKLPQKYCIIEKKVLKLCKARHLSGKNDKTCDFNKFGNYFGAHSNRRFVEDLVNHPIHFLIEHLHLKSKKPSQNYLNFHNYTELF